MIDQVFTEVIPLAQAFGGLDPVVVVDQIGRKLIGLAVQESVVSIKAPRERPLIEGPRRGRVLHRDQVPLANRQRRVAVLTHNLAHGRGVIGDLTTHRWKPRTPIGDSAHADAVMVTARQESGSRW